MNPALPSVDKKICWNFTSLHAFFYLWLAGPLDYSRRIEMRFTLLLYQNSYWPDPMAFKPHK